MRQAVIIISVIIGAYIIRDLWTISPDSRIITPFPLNRAQQISTSTYRWIGEMYVMMCLLTFCLWYLSSGKLSLWIKWAMIMQVLELIEYLAIYNAPWGHIQILNTQVPVNISTLRFLVLSFVTCFIFASWNR